MYQSGELYAYKNIVHLLSDELDSKQHRPVLGKLKNLELITIASIMPTGSCLMQKL